MFSGTERHTSFAKVHNISMNENYVFLNHVANEFQLTQMVYERFMLNILVFTEQTCIFKTCMSFMTSDEIVLVTIRD
ncbi:hypothetical protein Hanom_Chr06g00502101 [Helianthus anomalus]